MYEQVAFKNSITLPGVDEERTQANPLYDNTARENPLYEQADGDGWHLENDLQTFALMISYFSGFQRHLGGPSLICKLASEHRAIHLFDRLT